MTLAELDVRRAISNAALAARRDNPGSTQHLVAAELAQLRAETAVLEWIAQGCREVAPATLEGRIWRTLADLATLADFDPATMGSEDCHRVEAMARDARDLIRLKEGRRAA